MISNSMFHSFQVQILIQKDDTNNKVFERKFYIIETKEKIKRIKYCKFVVICGTNLRESVQ